MSRTDVHVPYWVWAQWYEPVHDIWCEFYLSRFRQKVPKQACNLPKRAVRHAGRPTGRKAYPYDHRCTWEPMWLSWRQARWLHIPPTPRSFVRHVWNGPERVRQRAQLHKMAKEYNAAGRIEDDDFPNYQHRHCARWLWD